MVLLLREPVREKVKLKSKIEIVTDLDVKGGFINVWINLTEDLFLWVQQPFYRNHLAVTFIQTLINPP